MALKSRDKLFRLPKISLLDFKVLEMDRVLTMLFARIHHKGEDSRLFKKDTTVDTFEAHFLSQPNRFKDFGKYPAITRGWLQTHLLDLVNRGKAGKEAVAAPRPLHGYTYRFRNPRHCRDYGTAQHIYETLYHLRLMKLLPDLVKRKGTETICLGSNCPVRSASGDRPQGDCPYQIGLFLDVQNQPGTRVSQLAEISAELHYRRIPGFVRSYFLTKKLDEFALDLLRTGRLQGGTNRQLSVAEVLRLLDDCHKTDREQYFGSRLMSMEEDTAIEDNTLDPEVQAVKNLGLDNLNTYVECLMALRGDYQRSFIVKSLDSLLLKNRPGALLAQLRSRNAPRRFVLDSRLLEVLLQIAVLRFDTATNRYCSEEIQIDRLLLFLRERYGLYIDALPRGEGFGEATIADCEALRRNKAAFKNKLREIGFFQDLSDAYITQHVTPRYRINHEPVSSPGGAV